MQKIIIHLISWLTTENNSVKVGGSLSGFFISTFSDFSCSCFPIDIMAIDLLYWSKLVVGSLIGSLVGHGVGLIISKFKRTP